MGCVYAWRGLGERRDQKYKYILVYKFNRVLGFAMNPPNQPSQQSSRAGTSMSPTDTPRLDKIVQIQNFHTKAMLEFKVKAEYIAASREINLSGVLQQVHSQGIKLQNSQIFFENTDAKMYVYLGTFPFPNTVYLKHEFCLDNYIRIKYKRLADSPKNANNSSSLQNQTNAPKTKENKPVRSIAEVMEAVRNWRKMQTDGSGNKKLTLNEAAELMGMSKKTLEDYAYQIQKGSQFGFNFQANKHQPIGVLRAFVRNKRKQLAMINNVDNYWATENSNSDDEPKPR